MLTGIVCIIAYLLLIAPVRIRIDIAWQGCVQADCWARVWGLPLGGSLRIGDGRGHMLPAFSGGVQVQGDAVRRAMADAGAVLRGNLARRYVTRHLRVMQLDACLRIGLDDAARTAVLTGAAHQFARWAHVLTRGKARILAVPAFAAERSSMEARCIVFFRAGHMIPVLTAALASWLLERREHRVTAQSGEV